MSYKNDVVQKISDLIGELYIGVDKREQVIKICELIDVKLTHYEKLLDKQKC